MIGSEVVYDGQKFELSGYGEYDHKVFMVWIKNDERELTIAEKEKVKKIINQL